MNVMPCPVNEHDDEVLSVWGQGILERDPLGGVMLPMTNEGCKSECWGEGIFGYVSVGP